MADLVIAAGNVAQGSGRVKILKSAIAGEAIDAGETCHLDSATSRILLGDANTEIPARVKGMALNSAAIGQPVDLIEEGEVDIGAGVAGTAYFQSSGAPGKIAPEADLGAGDFATFIGIGRTGGLLFMGPSISGQAKP